MTAKQETTNFGVPLWGSKGIMDGIILCGSTSVDSASMIFSRSGASDSSICHHSPVERELSDAHAHLPSHQDSNHREEYGMGNPYAG